jgi:diguanylate cyclase (GGDEF)-like protein/PAS domain S-box-containing protein
LEESELKKKHEEVLLENEYLRRINKELLESQFQQDFMEFSWSGNLGHWYWDFPANKVTFNPMKAQALGYTKEELPESVNFQFFTDKLHPDDYERVMDTMSRHLKGEIPVWEVKYRIQTKSGQYKTYYDRGKVTQRSLDGSPLFLSGIVFDISEDEEEKEKLLAQNKEWANRVKLDPITGLYNRSNTLFNLGKLVKNSEKNKTTLSIILLDIDNLSQQNRLFGALFGDEVLRTVGHVIKEHILENEYAGNFEGGKFLILLPDKHREEARELAEKLKHEIHSAPYSQPAIVKASASVAEYQLFDTVSEFFARAEELLQREKLR